MHEDVGRRQRFGVGTYVPVVGEEYDLRSRRDVSEHAERCRAAIVVELDEYVVHDEGHWLARSTGGLDGCETQRKEELVACPVAHPVLVRGNA